MDLEIITLSEVIQRKTNIVSLMASLVAQMVKNLPTVWETWVRFLGWEDPLEKGMATHSTILSGEFHGQRSLTAQCWCSEGQAQWTAKATVESPGGIAGTPP